MFKKNKLFFVGVLGGLGFAVGSLSGSLPFHTVILFGIGMGVCVGSLARLINLEQGKQDDNE